MAWERLLKGWCVVSIELLQELSVAILEWIWTSEIGDTKTLLQTNSISAHPKIANRTQNGKQTETTMDANREKDRYDRKGNFSHNLLKNPPYMQPTLPLLTHNLSQLNQNICSRFWILNNVFALSRPRSQKTALGTKRNIPSDFALTWSWTLLIVTKSCK